MEEQTKNTTIHRRGVRAASTATLRALRRHEPVYDATLRRGLRNNVDNRPRLRQSSTDAVNLASYSCFVSRVLGNMSASATMDDKAVVPGGYSGGDVPSPYTEDVPENLRRATGRLQFPPSYVVVGFYRLITDRNLRVPAWQKCKHGFVRGATVGLIWVSSRVRRLGDLDHPLGTAHMCIVRRLPGRTRSRKSLLSTS